MPKAISRDVWEKMFEVWVRTEKKSIIARTFDISLVTVRKYVEEGDEERGWPSFRERQKTYRREMLIQEKMDPKYIRTRLGEMAMIYLGKMDAVVRAFDEKAFEKKLKSMAEKGSLHVGILKDIMESLNKASRLLLHISGLPDEALEGGLMDDKYANKTTEELKKMLGEYQKQIVSLVGEEIKKGEFGRDDEQILKEGLVKTDEAN